jgi:tetratricopeptide (TPR) repeat protein
MIIYIRLSENYFLQQEYMKAIECLNEALEINKKYYPEDHPKILHIKTRISLMQRGLFSDFQKLLKSNK